MQVTNFPTQLSLEVSLRDEATFANFYAAEGDNAAALQALKSLAQVKDTQSHLIWGPHDSGISHLLQAVCHAYSEYADAHSLANYAQYLPLADLGAYPADEVCDGLDQASLLCVDDIDVIAGKSDWERALFHLFNRLKDAGKCMLVSAHASPSQLPLNLADLKSRIVGSAVYQISPLSDEGKAQALILRSRRRGMEMSEEVSAFILKRATRKTSELFALLEVLDAASMQQQRKLTIPFVKEVLSF